MQYWRQPLKFSVSRINLSSSTFPLGLVSYVRASEDRSEITARACSQSTTDNQVWQGFDRTFGLIRSSPPSIWPHPHTAKQSLLSTLFAFDQTLRCSHPRPPNACLKFRKVSGDRNRGDCFDRHDPEQRSRAHRAHHLRASYSPGPASQLDAKARVDGFSLFGVLTMSYK